MAKQFHGQIPAPDHQRIHRATDPRLRQPVPAINNPVENANVVLNKPIVTMNRAGSNPRNPILAGLGMRLEFALGLSDGLRGVFLYQDRANLGPNLKPSVMPIAPGMFALNLVPGSGQTVSGDHLIGAKRNLARVQSAFGTFEKEFWVKTYDAGAVAVQGQPALDAVTLAPVPIQVPEINDEEDWIDANIDFFVDWNDEFQALHNAKNPFLDPGFLKAYGGAKFVSLFDTFNADTGDVDEFDAMGSTPRTIPSGSESTKVAFNVSGITEPLDNVKVSFHYTNPGGSVGDAAFYLISPTGRRILLGANEGTGDTYGEDCTPGGRVFFNDGGTPFNVPSGDVPSGTYAPQDKDGLAIFKRFFGTEVNGLWFLEVVNLSGFDGFIQCATLELTQRGTTAGTEGVGVEVNPVTQVAIEAQHKIQIENVVGFKRITARFRSKLGSLNFVDVPFIVEVIPVVCPECPTDCEPSTPSEFTITADTEFSGYFEGSFDLSSIAATGFFGPEEEGQYRTWRLLLIDIEGNGSYDLEDGFLEVAGGWIEDDGTIRLNYHNGERMLFFLQTFEVFLTVGESMGVGLVSEFEDSTYTFRLEVGCSIYPTDPDIFPLADIEGGA